MITPKSFVSEFSLRYPINSVYTVVPCYEDYLLDFNYHVNRLSLNDNINNDNFYNQLIKSITSTIDMTPNTDNNMSFITICCNFNQNHSFYTIESMKSNGLFYNYNPDYINVTLFEYDRKNPLVKDCSWPIERSIIENNKLYDSSEIIMYSKNQLSEGLISNIIAIDENNQFVVPLHGTCLEGSMIRLVLKHLDDININYNRRNIYVSDLNKYTAICITSATRCLIPIKSIFHSNSNQILKSFDDYYYNKFNQIRHSLLNELVKSPSKSTFSYWYKVSNAKINEDVNKDVSY